MKNNDLERLLIEACDLLIILENDLTTPIEVKERITAIFMELKYADRIDSEMINCDGMLPDQEVQDWDIFGKQKI